jgi:nucleotide-binding universal stress UspA family protein
MNINKSNDVGNISEPEKNISKILVPIDGSEFSKKAADYAIFLSSKLDADLFVIHVLDDVPYEHNVGAFGLYDIETPDEIKQILREAREVTREWFDDIKTRAKEKNIRLIGTDLVTARSPPGHQLNQP